MSRNEKQQIFQTPVLLETEETLVKKSADDGVTPIVLSTASGAGAGKAILASDATAEVPEGAAPPVVLPGFTSMRANRSLPGAQRDDAGSVAAPVSSKKKKSRSKEEKKAEARAARKARKLEAIMSIPVDPVAKPAKLRWRHWWLVVSFAFMVLIPIAVVAWYMWFKAVDQYASSAGFTVQSEEGAAASDILGGIGPLVGGGTTQKDTDILYEYILSQQLVAKLQQQYDLRGLYAQKWDEDPAFAIWPDATIEDLLWYWKRIVSVSYDQTSGLMDVRVLAFNPQDAQRIAGAITSEGEILINELSAAARNDTIRYAESDLEDAAERLKAAREALTLFRTRTQIVDPLTDLASRQGVVANLQQSLVQALIEHDVLLGQTSPDDPRLDKAKRTIEVIRERINQERKNVTSGNATAAGDDSYPRLLAEYEGLQVDREFAEAGYRAALSALDAARDKAARKSRYLATYVEPTLPQTAEFPRRGLTTGLIGFFLFLAWSIVVLIYYSIRDSK